MRIDDNSLGFAKRYTQDDVGRLPSDTGQFEELSHFRRHSASVFSLDKFRRFTDMFGLVAEETRRMHHFFKTTRFGPGERACGFVFLEQCGCDEVDSFVCALCRKNCGNQELEGVRKIQFAFGTGIRRL